MAEVFLAAINGPAGFTKLCVLKRLHPHLEEEEALTGMFLDEARLAARLNHPHVVQTYEVGDVAGFHFLTMEYLEGQPFSRVLKALRRLDQPIPLAVGVKIFIDVLEGLDYAHSLKDFDGTALDVVHRDVSPGNIFLTYDGQVKVLDFGIAKAGTQLVETRAGQVKGKFAYIAPEQANAEAHDQRVDIWSLGVVMWEAFSGRRLFKGDSEVITLNNALNSEILHLDDVSDRPQALSNIIDRALQRDPEDRYPTARAMREDLEAFLNEHGLRASRSEVGAFVTGLFERERDEQRAVLNAFMRGESPGQSITAAGGTGSRSGVKSVEMDAYPEEEEGNRKKGMLIVFAVFLLAAVVGAVLAITSSGEPEGEPVAQAETPPPETSTPPTTPPTAPRVEPPPAMEPEAVTPTETMAPEPTEMSTPMTSEPPAQVEMASRPAVMVRRPVRRPARMRPEMRPAMVETEPEVQAMASPMVGEGFLTLDTIPWSQVRLDGRNLGTTPLLRERLPEGTHVLTLVNPERGLRTTYRVTIRPGQTTTRRVGLE